MEKNQINLKMVIVLLVIIIILLLGFGIFFVKEFFDERDEIRELYNSKNHISDSSVSNDRVLDNNDNVSNNSVLDNKDNISNDSTLDNDSRISREEALEVSLNDAKIKQSDVRDIDIELDYKYGKKVYEVTFDYQQYEYEYYINAENGEVVKSFREID